MSVVDIDREERRCARQSAWRAGEDVLPHPDACMCHECASDEVWASESQAPQ